MEFDIKYRNEGRKIWNINGKEMAFQIGKTKIYEVENALKIIPIKLKNNEPLSDLSEKIGVHQLLLLIYNFYLVDFLQYTENYFREGFENGKDVTLESFIIEKLEPHYSNPLGILSRTNLQALRDSIIAWTTNGCIEHLDIKKHLLEGRTMIHIGYVIGYKNIGKLLLDYYKDFFYDYVDKIYKKYAEERILFSYSKFYEIHIGGLVAANNPPKYKEIFKEIIFERYLYYANELINRNKDSLNINKDEWIVYQQQKNLNIASSKIDFSGILSDKFKLEFKKYYREKIIEMLLTNKDIVKVNNTLSTAIKVVNTLYNTNKIKCFSEIKYFDANLAYQYLKNEVVYGKSNTPLSVDTISRVISTLRQINSYLIENEISTRNHIMPTTNPFEYIKIRNGKKMTKSTDVIPESIMLEIIKHKHELSEMYQKMFDIFIGTGMRLKEVLFLEADCLEYRGDDIVLHFVPYKVLISQRRAKREDRHSIYITKDLATVIESQKEISSELREELDLNYIFLNEVGGKVRVAGSSLCDAVNKIIKKNNICDVDGSLWIFDTKQMRKTVAATMIENGATETEVMQQLNHVSSETTRKSYEDVEKKKLAELNSEFFKKEFELKVGKEQLALYTEEERRALYIDFKLTNRDVEFGKCTKHISEGPCGKKTGTISCANCPKICTGKQYLHKWEELIRNQEKRLAELEQEYKQLGIEPEEYAIYREYTLEKNQLEVYSSVRNSILGG